MCVAMYHEAGKVIPTIYLDNSAVNHPHGGGIAWINHEGKIEVWKTLDMPEVAKKYVELLKEFPNSPFIVHYRKCTEGVINMDNAHPFMIDDNTVFAHNKTIYHHKPKVNDKSGKSDTVLFNEEVLRTLPRGWMKSAGISALIEQYIANSRIVVMQVDKKGKHDVKFFGETKGDAGWDKDIWYSNDSYKKIASPAVKKESGNRDGLPAYAHPRQAGIDYGFYEWYEDGLRLRYNHHQKELHAWCHAQYCWRPYNNTLGEFISGPRSCKNHRPMAHKTGPVAKAFTSKVIQLPYQKGVQVATRKCSCCEEFHSLEYLTDCRIDHVEDMKLCTDCLKFYRQTNCHIQYS